MTSEVRGGPTLTEDLRDQGYVLWETGFYTPPVLGGV